MGRRVSAPNLPGAMPVEAARASTPPAPDVTVTVAPFRAWRDSRLIVAEEPTRATIDDSDSEIVQRPMVPVLRFRQHRRQKLAERVGFEPTWSVMPPTDFESVPL